MFTRCSTIALSLGLLLWAASPATAQGPDRSRGGPPKSGAAHAKGKAGKHHHHKHPRGSQASRGDKARKSPDARSQPSRSSSMNRTMPYGFSSFPGGPSRGSFSGPPTRGTMGGFGGGGSGFPGGMTRGFGGSVSGGLGGMSSNRGTSTSSSELAALKRDVAELRASVDKLTEALKKERR